MLIFNKRPSPSGLGQNMPNKFGIICVPENGARPEQCLANNISQTVWSMKHNNKKNKKTEKYYTFSDWDRLTGNPVKNDEMKRRSRLGLAT